MHLIGIAVSMILSIFLSFLIGETGWAEAVTMADNIRLIESGSQPEGDVDKVDLAAAKANIALSQLRDHIAPERVASTQACARFIDLSNRLARQLQTDLTKFVISVEKLNSHSDLDFSFVNRLQIAISAFSEMDFLINSGADGGYSVLDLSSRIACPFRDRVAFSSSFRESLTLLSGFFRSAFGRPGLNKIDAIERRLLRMMVQDEYRDEKKAWMLVAGGTVASLAVWQFGVPAAIASVRWLWGYIPRLLTIPAILFGAKVSALTAESAALYYVDRATNLAVPPPENVIGSWDEHMDAIEVFLNSPVRSPALHYTFLTRIHSHLFTAEGE